MGRHEERDRPRRTRGGAGAAGVRDDHGLEVIGHRQQPALPPEQADVPYEEPDQYGLRISWQSEEERLEAAAFLLATRIQEDTRLRVSREFDELRHRED